MEETVESPTRSPRRRKQLEPLPGQRRPRTVDESPTRARHEEESPPGRTRQPPGLPSPRRNEQQFRTKFWELVNAGRNDVIEEEEHVILTRKHS